MRTMGSRRRPAARASSARVISFSLASSLSLAACHSASDAIFGSGVFLVLIALPFLVVGAAVGCWNVF